jgi:hypothetical protein
LEKSCSIEKKDDRKEKRMSRKTRYVGDGGYTLAFHGSILFLLQEFNVKGEVE